MKMRLGCFLIILGAVCSMTVFAAQYHDVPLDNTYFAAVSALGDEGILTGYEDGSFRPKNKITRAEAAAVIVRACGLENSYAANSVYSDVANDFWGREYIMIATEASILNGMGNGAFEPNSNVTYNQIIKMIVCMKGLEEKAASMGGWPYGYVKVAYENDIVNSTIYRLIMNDSYGEEPAIRGDVAQFVYNAVHVREDYILSVGDKSYYIGMPEAELDVADEKLPSTSGYTWYVYGTDTYKELFAAGVADGEVVALASTGPGFSYMGYQSGDIAEENENLLTDKNDNNIVHGVLIIKDTYAYKRNVDDDALFGESKMNFHFTNGFRVYHGLKPCIWSDKAHVAARLHSVDMADNNYFSHDSLDGRAFSQRLNEQRISWSYCAENISAGRYSGILTYDGWVNSAGHRSNILGSHSKYLGVGAGYNDDSTYQCYFTQDFFSN